MRLDISKKLMEILRFLPLKSQQILYQLDKFEVI